MEKYTHTPCLKCGGTGAIELSVCQTCEDEFKNEEAYDPSTHTCGKEKEKIISQCLCGKHEAPHEHEWQCTGEDKPRPIGQHYNKWLCHCGASKIVKEQNETPN